ncbi:Uncharacterised protein [Bordetella pertussis]|nr:Uncharacterised protein [Bordetella pertussis]
MPADTASAPAARRARLGHGRGGRPGQLRQYFSRIGLVHAILAIALLLRRQARAQRQYRRALGKQRQVRHVDILGRAQHQLQAPCLGRQQQFVHAFDRHRQHGVARRRGRLAALRDRRLFLALRRPVDRTLAIGQHLDARLQQAGLRARHLDAAVHDHEHIDQVAGQDAVLGAAQFVHRDGDGALAGREVAGQAARQHRRGHGLARGDVLAHHLPQQRLGFGVSIGRLHRPALDLQQVGGQAVARGDGLAGHHHRIGRQRRAGALRHRLGRRRRRTGSQHEGGITQPQRHQRQDGGGNFRDGTHVVGSCAICTMACALNTSGNQARAPGTAPAAPRSVASSGQPASS